MEIAHEDKSLRRGWQFTGWLKSILNFGAVVWNGLMSLLLQIIPKEAQKRNSVEDALSNSLILKNIFIFLDDADLESCCYVCQDWRTVADPLVLSQYEIKLDRIYAPYNPPLAKHYVFVRGLARYNRKSFTQRTDIAGVRKMFEDLRSQNVSISLKISEAVDTQDDQVIDFILKIGPLIVDLDLSKIIQLPMNVFKFCKLLPQKFPNLKKLSCSGFCPPEVSKEDQFCGTDLPQDKHKELKTISFESEYLNVSSIKTILKTCVNLKEIESFPLEFIKAIVIAVKGQALKSLSDTTTSSHFHRFQKNGETIVTAYKKLARLQPKLTSLRIDSNFFSLHADDAFEMARPFLISILRSSHESLESLGISPLSPEDFQYFPILQGLKELQLFPQFCDHGDFFPSEQIQVGAIFPNVRKITSSSTHWDEAYVNRFFPETIITPWGSQIIELSIGDVDVSCVPLVQKRFPSIQKLELLFISATDLPNLLLQLTQSWPQLKSLAITLQKYYLLKDRNLMDGSPMRLDHAFTGLPEIFIDQLEDPSRKKDFTEEQIQEFKDGSIISKLKELKELKLFLGDYLLESGLERGTYMRLTPVANEFGFKLLPELRVTVGIQKNQMFAKEIETDLEPLAMYSNVELVYDFPFL